MKARRCIPHRKTRREKEDRQFHSIPFHSIRGSYSCRVFYLRQCCAWITKYVRSYMYQLLCRSCQQEVSILSQRPPCRNVFCYLWHFKRTGVVKCVYQRSSNGVSLNPSILPGKSKVYTIKCHCSAKIIWYYCYNLQLKQFFLTTCFV